LIEETSENASTILFVGFHEFQLSRGQIENDCEPKLIFIRFSSRNSTKAGLEQLNSARVEGEEKKLEISYARLMRCDAR
jgi:heme-degrading monooxygenase HmoA